MCVEVAASLAGLRWELPCVTNDPNAPELVCFTTGDVSRAATMQGPPGATFAVQVRVRGVVETRQYFGGTMVAPFVVRGAEAMPSTADAWNVYRLEVSDPLERWYLNASVSGEYVCRLVDSTFTIRVRPGAQVRLFASPVDGRLSQITNRNEQGMAIVVPGVAPAPQPFNGQFLQLDVISVTRVP